ncbi:hypothetical protein [Amycolatopsis mediterranei]|uniref:hypothetical protein n=1 Tax=Amycolatopsis mediterranei TaxID=33910 RepID=UPI00114D2C8B|nr:hypothetical protein [Amycolatopsis mediterranei]UZF73977.1 hypothetical protein ISP_007454 [Amycolatopsis mediterranei]
MASLDTESVLHSVAKTGRLVVAHQAVEQFGWGPSWPPSPRRRASGPWTPR